MSGFIIYLLIGSNLGFFIKYVLDPWFDKRYNNGISDPQPFWFCMMPCLIAWPLFSSLCLAAVLFEEYQLHKERKRDRKREKERMEREIQNLRERIYALETR